MLVFMLNQYELPAKRLSISGKTDDPKLYFTY